jgi:hypothetical protein
LHIAEDMLKKAGWLQRSNNKHLSMTFRAGGPQI